MKKGILSFLMLVMGSFFTLNAEAPMTAKRPVLVIETNKGNIEVTLFPDIAPKACENFMKLAEKGKYNDVVFHRIIPNFMIQGGDYPTPIPVRSKSIWGLDFEDECKANVKFDRPGLLAMANAGPKTNSSQFFITTVQTPWLHMKHTIFGEVTQGMEVVKALEAVGTPGQGIPKEVVKIIKVTVKSQ